ncbi:MAG: hypothetical protein O6758_09315 [Planctomycetota bacterium]|nr:hypothetical protein [Planctomycetota bacterium]
MEILPDALAWVLKIGTLAGRHQQYIRARPFSIIVFAGVEARPVIRGEVFCNLT